MPRTSQALPTPPPRVRELAADELGRAIEIDVGEEGTAVYRQSGTRLERRPEPWARPSRTAATWAAFAARWRGILAGGGVALGAFDGDRLVGIAVLRFEIEPGVAQLDSLFVDRGHRRRGIADRLTTEVEERARLAGARTLYVSATPSDSAVGFYRRRGFEPTARPNPELLSLEPDDVHMTRTL